LGPALLPAVIRDNLNAAALGMIDHRGVGDADDAAAAGGGGELLDDGPMSAPCRGVDVEVAEHRGVVDGRVEDALAGRLPVELREVQAHRVADVWRGGGHGGGEVAMTLGGVDR